MLMHPDNRSVDHLDSGIVCSGKRVYYAAPDNSPSPAAYSRLLNGPGLAR